MKSLEITMTGVKVEWLKSVTEKESSIVSNTEMNGIALRPVILEPFRD
jgi:hypothetical protein